MKLAWSVDLHLVFLTPTPMQPGDKRSGLFERLAFLGGANAETVMAEDDLTPFLEELAGQSFDALAISGDISEAPKLEWHLRLLEEYLQRPVYFVLGNHDYYHSSFEEVLPRMEKFKNDSKLLHCMECEDWIDLTPTTGLIGHGCWADGRYGDFDFSPSIQNDWKVIEELKQCWNVPPGDLMQRRLSAEDLDREALLDILHTRGDRARDHIERVLIDVLGKKDKAILITHAPPFLPAQAHRSARWEDWAPHAGCKAAGDAILEIMRDLPGKELMILSGHIHASERFNVTPNIEQRIGFAEYLEPRIAEVFEL